MGLAVAMGLLLVALLLIGCVVYGVCWSIVHVTRTAFVVARDAIHRSHP